MLDRLDILSSRGVLITLCWIPSHVGIHGNEAADGAAREAIDLEDIQPIYQPHNDSRQSIREHVLSKWQGQWDLANNDLHQAHPTLPYRFTARLPRREERVMARVHIGHTRLTHSYRLDRVGRPQCRTCQVDLTIQHLLLDCREFDFQRTSLLEGSTLAEVFEKTPANIIINFFKRTNHFHLI